MPDSAFCNEGKCTRASSNNRDQFHRYKDRLKNVEKFTRDAIDLIKLKDSEDTFFI